MSDAFKARSYEKWRGNANKYFKRASLDAGETIIST